MHRSLFAILLLGSLLAVPALGRSAIFTLTDPRGDDNGDGNLIYPLNEELNPGDLDLTSFRAEAEGSGTRFEITFAKPIRVPGAEVIDGLGTQLKDAARFGFYTFNVDIYIDTDRVPGSGGVNMLPGRHAQIDRNSAWEKALILTPRPHEARGELKRILMRNLSDEAKDEKSDIDDQEAAALRAQIPVDVDERIWFPNQVTVRGNRVSFFVPGIFLGGPAKDTWSYVVVVSGASLLQRFDASRVLGRGTQQEEALMILPISPGRWQDRFGGGRENAANQPPLVDLIVPKGKVQASILQDFDGRTRRPVVLPGVVPAEQK